MLKFKRVRSSKKSADANNNEEKSHSYGVVVACLQTHKENVKDSYVRTLYHYNPGSQEQLGTPKERVPSHHASLDQLINRPSSRDSLGAVLPTVPAHLSGTPVLGSPSASLDNFLDQVITSSSEDSTPTGNTPIASLLAGAAAKLTDTPSLPNNVGQSHAVARITRPHLHDRSYSDGNHVLKKRPSSIREEGHTSNLQEAAEISNSHESNPVTFMGSSPSEFNGRMSRNTSKSASTGNLAYCLGNASFSSTIVGSTMKYPSNGFINQKSETESANFGHDFVDSVNGTNRMNRMNGTNNQEKSLNHNIKDENGNFSNAHKGLITFSFDTEQNMFSHSFVGDDHLPDIVENENSDVTASKKGEHRSSQSSIIRNIETVYKPDDANHNDKDNDVIIKHDVTHVDSATHDTKTDQLLFSPRHIPRSETIDSIYSQKYPKPLPPRRTTSTSLNIRGIRKHYSDSSLVTQPPAMSPDVSTNNAHSLRDKKIESWSSLSSISSIDSVSSPPSIDLISSPSLPDMIELELQPLDFANRLISSNASSHFHVEREWVYSEILKHSSGPHLEENHGGVFICGQPGTGKTSLFARLFLHQWINDSVFEDGSKNIILSKAALELSQHIVGYHFCFVEDRDTCSVPEFVYSLSSMLAYSEQLTEYHELLLNEPWLQAILTKEECRKNPSKAFREGVLEPLCKLSGKVQCQPCFIVVDGLDELKASLHSTNNSSSFAQMKSTNLPGYNLIHFLADHFVHFPSWLHVIFTGACMITELERDASFQRVCLDQAQKPHVAADLRQYISTRISCTHRLQSMIAGTSSSVQKRVRSFGIHIQNFCKGSFLYVKRLLNDVENGIIQVPEELERLPDTLHKLYFLEMNGKLQNAFDKVEAVLNVVFASSLPLTDIELFEATTAGSTDNGGSWGEFVRMMDVLSDILMKRGDGRRVLSHHTLREWLLKGYDGNVEFKCDARRGHSVLAVCYLSQEEKLDSDQTLELTDHLLHSTMFDHVTGGDKEILKLQADMLTKSTADVQGAFMSWQNMLTSDVIVYELLLLAGANTNQTVESCEGMLPLSIAAGQGRTDIAALLLQYTNGFKDHDNTITCALREAARHGHVHIFMLLHQQGGDIMHNKPLSQSPIVLAAEGGYLDLLKYILNCYDSFSDESIKMSSMQLALTSAAQNNHLEVVEMILQRHGSEAWIDDSDVRGHTPLTAAAVGGAQEMVKKLLKHGATLNQINRHGHSALMCAAEANRWELVDWLLSRGADLEQSDWKERTPLMVSSSEGHHVVVELLLSKGADVRSHDSEGMAALSHAAQRAHLPVVRSLLDRGASLAQVDNSGKTALHLACLAGDPQVVTYLLDKGASLDNRDNQGLSPIEHAITNQNLPVVMTLLKRGAKVGPSTWSLATKNANVILLLLNQIVEEGNSMFKKGQLKEALTCYHRTLDRCTCEVTTEKFQELKVTVHLNLSRSYRKLQDLSRALEHANKALEIRPQSSEAYYTRARAYRVVRNFEMALLDLQKAVLLDPTREDIQKLLEKVRLEQREGHHSTHDGIRSQSSV